MDKKERKPLSEIMMADGKQTAQEYVDSREPEAQPYAIEAIYECLEKGWSLNLLTVARQAREIRYDR